jgi:predicted neutral ceramidase superfamily lipid hydrolase
MKKSNQTPFSIKKIFFTTLVAGTLDGLTAVIFLGKMNFMGVFQYIASAIFGKEAFAGGIETALIGLALHYFIAFSFTLVFTIASTKTSALKQNIILSGIIYGIIVWTIMTLLIVPLTKIPAAPFNYEQAILNVVILIFCIGLPISYLTARKFN